MIWGISILIAVWIWALLLVPYLLWLRKTTLFIAQRIYLYVSLVTGIITGLFWTQSWRIIHELPPILEPLIIENLTSTAVVRLNELTLSTILYMQAHWYTLLITMYSVGTAFLFSLFIWRISQLYRIARSHTIQVENGRAIVRTIDIHTPFSFFNYIYFSRLQDLSPDDTEIILKHESVHTRQWHSIDILLSEFLFVFTWVIPIIYIYKWMFIELHEYIADERVNRDVPLSVYGALLIQQSLGEGKALTHNFSFGDLKARILKMKQKRSKPFHYTSILGIGVFFIIGINLLTLINLDFLNTLTKGTTQKDPLYTGEVYLTPVAGFTIVGDQKVISPVPTPRYPGGWNKMGTFLHDKLQLDNLPIPENQKVYVRLNFDAYGKLNLITLLQPPLSSEFERSIRVALEQMPDWIPPTERGKAIPSEIIVPIVFSAKK